MTPKEKANLLVWHGKKPKWYAEMAKREWADREVAGSTRLKHVDTSHWADAYFGCILHGHWRD